MVIKDFEIKWDPKNVEIKSLSVEKAIEPLILKVTTLVNSDGYSKEKKGCSVKAPILLATVEEAIRLFVEKGEIIAKENPDAYNEIIKAVIEVKETGKQMVENSIIFVEDPCSSNKRALIIKSARSLLSSVTRLLIIADMVDTYNLLKKLQKIEDSLENFRMVSTQHEFLEKFKTLSQNMQSLYKALNDRQKDAKDPVVKDNLACARACLQKNRDLLYTTTQAYLRHPEISAAKANRDYILDEMIQSLALIDKVSRRLKQQGGEPQDDTFTDFYYPENNSKSNHDNNEDFKHDLAQAIEKFQQQIAIQPTLAFSSFASTEGSIASSAFSQRLEASFDDIFNGAMGIANSSSTRDETREKILESCDNVKKALQNLFECMDDQTNHQHNNYDSNDKSRILVDRNAEELKRQLRRAVVDHVSDSFLETGVPLMILSEAALSGDAKSLDRAAKLFEDHAQKLIQVAELACSLSTQLEGVKFVKLASRQLGRLYPQVVNAARVLLIARPASGGGSKAARENFTAFAVAWQTQVRILTEAVDDITTISDFLAVSETHILEDIDACIKSFRTRDTAGLDRFAGAVRGRSLRVCEVVLAEMSNYDASAATLLEAFVGGGDVSPLESENIHRRIRSEAEATTHYTAYVRGCVNLVKQQLIPFFSDRVSSSLNYLNGNESDTDTENQATSSEIRDNEFIEANRFLFDGIRDIREAVESALISSQESTTAVGGGGLTGGEDYYETYGYEYDDNYEENNVDKLSEYETTSSAGRGNIAAASDRDNARNHKTNLAQPNENDRAIMRQLPQEAKAKIQREIKSFREQKAILDREVSKWEDSGNDIVVIAKRMCIIMMEMTDFTRGRGPLKSTMDVIGAAQKISEVGKGLDILARTIADTCPESQTKKDLLAYLERLDLYCQQLAITSKVKADVSNVGGEVVVSGLDSVTSLITASKNLMNTVVLIVKSSYVASTKYTSKSAKVMSVVWRMKPPEKKPLIRVDRYAEMGYEERNGKSIIRRASNKRREAPIRALNEFHQNF